jgi:hypothetical protein
MKSLLIAVGALLLPAFGLAVYPNPVNRSCFTITNESAYVASSFLDSVVVGSAGISGNLKIYNSTWTASGLIANISLTDEGSYDFKDMQVKGLFYVTTSNTPGGVTILYKK